MRLQAELTSLRQMQAHVEEESRQYLQELGGARKHRELLLEEVEQARADLDRLQRQKSALVSGPLPAELAGSDCLLSRRSGVAG